MNSSNPQELQQRIAELEAEVRRLQQLSPLTYDGLKTVSCPDELQPLFTDAQQKVGQFFSEIKFNPEEANISIDGDRYVLLRASSLSIDFLEKITQLYADKGESEALKIGQNFLFDISHVIGLEDAKNIHKKLELKDPISRLSAGPVHFAYSGWAYVNILEGVPTSDENYYLRYTHPHSFEADAWISKGKKSSIPVCIMNSGYSSGWCEQSFGIPLTAVEIKCRAKGDDQCEFIMAHPNRIEDFLKKENIKANHDKSYDIPMFFQRKKVEQELINSLEEKTMLLQEVHHRVKNNLQIISSLLNLQSQYLEAGNPLDMFNETKNRIKAIAMVHEKLYKSDDIQHANFVEYIESIVKLLQDSYGEGIKIGINTLNVDDARIPIERAIPCGLIINEVVTNSIKHAFSDWNIKDPNIMINLEIVNGRTKMSIADNGKGLPANFNIRSTQSLGLELVCSLVDQLDGKIGVSSDAGTTFTLECGGH